MTSSWKTTHVWPRWINVNISMLIQLYTLIQRFNIIQKYITGLELISSKFISYLYGLIQRILYLMFFGTYCKFTVSLVKHCIITNRSLYGVSYLYSAWLLSMNLSPSLESWSTQFLFLRILSFLIWVCFCWRINYWSTVCFIEWIISRPNTYWPGL